MLVAAATFIAALVIGSGTPTTAFIEASIFVGCIALDAVDGAVARHQGKCSEFGSFVDVICDRCTEYSAWLFLVLVNSSWGFAVLPIIGRDVLVDSAKWLESRRGADLGAGVILPGGWRSAVIAGRWSKFGYNSLKAIVVVTAILGASSLGGARDLVVPLLIATAIFSVVRSVASVSELPKILKGAAKGGTHWLENGYLAQATIGLGVLAITLGLTLRP